MASLRKPCILFILLLIAAKSHAQNYELIFAGSGASDSVDSVFVENLMQHTTLAMDGGDILHLVKLATRH